MSLVSLDHDSLSIVVSHLSSSDAHQLSLVARAVHFIAKQRALHSVVLTLLAKMAAFCTYMLSDVPNRLRWLRNLQIQYHPLHAPPYRTFPSFAAHLLADLLEQAANLKSISLLHAESWLRSEPRIGLALSALRNLQEINLGGAGGGASEALSAMRSLPQRLILNDIHMSPATEDASFNLGPECQWLSVKHLSISVDSNDWNATLPVAALSHAFPKVHALHVGHVGNRHHSQAPPEVCWRSLAHVCGDPGNLAGWRNVTRIHHLQVTKYLREPPTGGRCGTSRIQAATDRHYVWRAVQSALPVALTVSAASRISSQFWTSLVKASYRLRYLSFHLPNVLCDDGAQAEFIGWMNMVSSVLAGSSVICLEVEISAILPQVDCRTCLPDSFETSVNRAVAAFPKLAKMISPLRYCSLDLGEEYSHLDVDGVLQKHVSPFRKRVHWWRIVDRGDERTAQPLDPVLGEQIGEYLRSPRYDYSSEFDEAKLSCHVVN